MRLPNPQAWVTAALLASVALSAQATLQGRDLDGNAATFEAYYDTDLNISWLANANAGAGSSVDDAQYYSPGAMTWAHANAWVAGLSVNGISGWRLPAAIFPDPGCSRQLPVYGGADGQGCSVSEMAHLYNVEGIKANAPGGFANLQSSTGNGALYWTGTSISGEPTAAWGFTFASGGQTGDWKTDGAFAFAVHDGDVGLLTTPVPEPGTYGLMLLGSLAVGAVARRRRNQA